MRFEGTLPAYHARGAPGGLAVFLLLLLLLVKVSRAISSN
jgi:hypothetical protein